jgi:hypothetical protein
MKSAYELAMERMGTTLHCYTSEQKEQLAELDRVYAAKIAQAKLHAGQKVNSVGSDPAMHRQVMDDLQVELASLESRRDKEKEALRASFKSH